MQLLHAGLDIGSTTAKVVVLDEYDRIIFSRYSRHFADIRAAVSKLVNEMRDRFSGSRFTLAMAGSGALELARGMDVPFTQEQIACTASIARFLPGVDVCIELGGEDAKITFFDPSGAEQRMNETCAGGTGAFLDQMATLFGTDAAGLNEMAKGYKTIYPVASRCGVFAKTDVQALLNDGASKPDIAASIFQAIVNQTISGLACGRRIQGRVAFLGGPLYFLSELRKRFSETLKLPPEQCIFPENPHLFVAMGAAISAKQYGAVAADVLQKRAEHFFISHKEEKHSILPPLFGSETELDSFKERHSKCAAKRVDIASYKGDAYLGIDVGSTTTKVVLIGSQGELLFSRYKINGVGEPVKTVREVLSELYSLERRHRLRRKADTGGLRHRRRRGRDRRARARRGLRAAWRGLRHRHRRTGYEMSAHQGRRHRRRIPQRSLLLGLRLLPPELREVAQHGDGRVRARRGAVAQPRRPRLALHRLHEFARPPGAEGGRGN